MAERLLKTLYKFKILNISTGSRKWGKFKVSMNSRGFVAKANGWFGIISRVGHLQLFSRAFSNVTLSIHRNPVCFGSYFDIGLLTRPEGGAINVKDELCVWQHRPLTTSNIQRRLYFWSKGDVMLLSWV